MPQTIEDRIDRLRILSEAKPSEHYKRLKEIQKQSKMIGNIFGVYGAANDKKEPKPEEKELKEMTFEEKRKLLEAQFPNAVSAEKRAKAREALNFIANNPELFFDSSPLSIENNVLTSRSWPSTCDSADELTAPRVRNKENIKTMESNSSSEHVQASRRKKKSKPSMEIDSRFNGTWKFGNFDNFAKIVPPDVDESTNTVKFVFTSFFCNSAQEQVVS
uniref:Uncharacterized protein n=1 Tax=Caenorhabditis tropicalis TaxID=1561998 RepID=A0A1I7TY95_9PELO